jgi:hypothetical protein
MFVYVSQDWVRVGSVRGWWWSNVCTSRSLPVSPETFRGCCFNRIVWRGEEKSPDGYQIYWLHKTALWQAIETIPLLGHYAIWRNTIMFIMDLDKFKGLLWKRSTDLWRWYFKYNYHNCGNDPLSCLLFKAQCFEDWVLSPPQSGTYSVGFNSAGLCLRR